MTITSRIHEQLFAPTAAALTTDGVSETRVVAPRLIRMSLSRPRGGIALPDQSYQSSKRRRRRRRPAADPKTLALAWSADEHERFLRGLELFPRGPWKDVAHFVGTRTVRQTMTHAQKYRQKIARHQRGLQTEDAGRKLREPVRLLLPDPISPNSSLMVSAASPRFKSTPSPSSVEQLNAQGAASWMGFASAAPPCPPESPLMPQWSECEAPNGASLPVLAACGADEFEWFPDDAELDALLFDGFVHSDDDLQLPGRATVSYEPYAM